MEQEILTLLEGVGGKDNIIRLEHCVTRLRFALRDDTLVNDTLLQTQPFIKGIYRQNGQFQIVIGPKVKDYYDALKPYLKQSSETRTSNQTSLQYLAGLVSEIFAPLIPLLIMGGLCSGLENIFSVLPSSWSITLWLTQLFHLINLCAFNFIPVVLLWSIVKKMNGSEVLAIALGLSLMISAYVPSLNLFHHYEGQVIPAVFGALLLVYLERLLRQWTPESVAMLAVPLGSLIISIVVMQLFLGPIASDINQELAAILVWCLTSQIRWLLAPLVGYGFAYVVKSGLHHFTVPLDLLMISAYRVTYLWPLLVLSNVAQGAACYCLTFQLPADQKKEAKKAALSCFLGVSEPAMFGFNLLHQDPFRYATIASAFACLFAGHFRLKAYSIGIGGLPGILTMVIGWDWLIAILAMLLALLIPYYVMTNTDERKQLYRRLKERYSKKKNQAEQQAIQEDASSSEETVALSQERSDETDENTVATEVFPIEIVAPVSGQLLALSEVHDEVFASGTMGPGIAFIPENGHFVAPLSGQLTTVFPTGHAYGITTDGGIEVLLHIGINSVQLNHEGFIVHVNQGEKIKAGDPLVDVDLDKLKESGCALDTPLIFIGQTQISCEPASGMVEQMQRLTIQINKE